MGEIDLALVEIDPYSFICPRNTRYVEFDHNGQGKAIHVFVVVDEKEYKFSITPAREEGSPEDLANLYFLTNATHSLPSWNIPPYCLEGSKTPGWVCGFGLMEGKCLRIMKTFFQIGQEVICLTFVSQPEEYEAGAKCFHLINRTFTIVEREQGISPAQRNKGVIEDTQ